MGSLFKIPVVQVEHIASFIALLQGHDIQLVGTAVQDGTLLPQAHFSEKGTAVFMGNEYWGLPETIQSQMDVLATIPMVQGIDSFSINAAAAIILYEIRRSKL